VSWKFLPGNLSIHLDVAPTGDSVINAPILNSPMVRSPVLAVQNVGETRSVITSSAAVKMNLPSSSFVAAEELNVPQPLQTVTGEDQFVATGSAVANLYPRMPSSVAAPPL